MGWQLAFVVSHPLRAKTKARLESAHPGFRFREKSKTFEVIRE